MLNALGTRSAGVWPIGVNWPVEGSTLNPAMESCPLFGAYKKLPDGVICIWEQELSPS